MRISNLVLSIAFLSIFFCTISANAKVLRGSDGSELTLAQLVSEVPEGAIVVLGERHDDPSIAAQQVNFLKALGQAQAGPIHVGMEFFEWPSQNLLDAYLAGSLKEADFLSQVRWGKTNFAHYRAQLLFPQEHHPLGKAWGLNAPRALASRISRNGMESLTPEERAQLPPDFTRGNAGYFRRFAAEVGHVTDPLKLERFFLAQSLWDDSMAWQALARKPASDTLVIVIGEFHVKFGGGLPDRIQARGFPADKLITISQVDLRGLSEEEKRQELAPDPEFGARAGYLFTIEE